MPWFLQMHILIMLALVIGGFAAGQNLTYLIGLPMICGGLYVGFGDWGGKKGARYRATGEEIFFLIGLLSIPLIIVANIFNL